MLDIKLIRDNPALFDAGLKKRGVTALSAEILDLDHRRRAAQTGFQEGQARRNEASKQNGMVNTDMINSAGKRVKPKLESFAAAASNADWNSAPNFNLVIVNQPGDASWPMTNATFILMYSQPDDKAAAAAALAFFDWSFANGGKMAEELDYIPMPDAVVAKIKSSAWTTIITK